MAILKSIKQVMFQSYRSIATFSYDVGLINELIISIENDPRIEMSGFN